MRNTAHRPVRGDRLLLGRSAQRAAWQIVAARGEKHGSSTQTRGVLLFGSCLSAQKLGTGDRLGRHAPVKGRIELAAFGLAVPRTDFLAAFRGAIPRFGFLEDFTGQMFDFGRGLTGTLPNSCYSNGLNMLDCGLSFCYGLCSWLRR